MRSVPLRAPKGLWEEFGDAVAEAEPESDRAKALRSFMRWYTGKSDRLPRRPDRFDQ
jgi:hypothetical protein